MFVCVCVSVLLMSRFQRKQTAREFWPFAGSGLKSEAVCVALVLCVCVCVCLWCVCCVFVLTVRLCVSHRSFNDTAAATSVR